MWVDAVNFSLEAVEVLTVGHSLDYPGFGWQTGQWFSQNTITFDGEDAIQAKSLGDSSEAVMTLELHGPGTLSFYYRVSSEEGYDFFIFEDSNTQFLSDSGEVGWTKHTQFFGAGTHQLLWKYSKDSSVSSFDDTAWIDRVEWTSSNLSPYSSWQNQYFTGVEQSAEEVGGALADPDGDGYSNLLEYSQGNSPISAAQENVVSLSYGVTEMILDYPVDTSVPDVNVIAFESTDLNFWTPLNEEVLEINGMVETRRVRLPMSDTRGFMRIEVSIQE